uniref:Uncharacterized protein n=1 Tax=viral metagenome TaxID=1070528 RepID=A0A6C0KZM4_9ZZZZ|tara:strand:- start:3178 stop:3651 length:474 start_codon:yes stop_codon:yes gene_type:complete
MCILNQIKNLPNELKIEIMNWLPIVSEKQKLINIGIRNISKMSNIINIYTKWFETGETNTNKAIISCAIGWVYNDLSYFLNNFTPPSEKIVQSYSNILYLITKKRITNLKELEEYEDSNSKTVSMLLFDHVVYMTEYDLSNFWNYARSVYNMDEYPI